MQKTEIRKKIYSMIIPIIIENVLQMAVGIVSMGMIGRINVEAVTAQGMCLLVVGILWSLFKGISIGGTVLVAKAYGADNHEKIRGVSQQTLLSSLILVMGFQQLLFWKPDIFLGLFNPIPHTLQIAIQYLRIVSCGLPFVTIMLCVTGIMQGLGNARTPLLIATIMNAANILLSYTLIFGQFGFKAYGLKGAAISLVTSQFIGAACGLYVLFRNDGILKDLRGYQFFKIDLKQAGEIYRIGFPSAFESIFWQTASIILSRVILSFGEVAFASNQLGLQAESISEMPALGFGVVATAFTGKSLGAMNKKLGKEYLLEIGKGAVLVISAGVVILLFFPRMAMRLLTNNEQVIELGAVYLRLMGLIQIPQNLQRVFTGALKGAGFTRIPMVVAGIGLWGIRIPASIILTRYFHYSIVAIWVVVCIDQTFRFILSYILYKRKNIFKEETTG